MLIRRLRANSPSIVATILYERFHTSTAVAVYLSVSAVISLACVAALGDKAGALDHR